MRIDNLYFFIWKKLRLINMLLLNVPYSDKDEVKKLGAKWNPDSKSWYIESKRDYYKFVKWILNGKSSVDIICDKFYIIKSERSCWHCGRITPVYAMAFDSSFSLYDLDYFEEEMVPIKYNGDNLFISSFPTLPPKVSNLVVSLCNCYMDYSNTTKSRYIANHCCHCNALQGNWPLFCDVDSPFDIDNLYNYIAQLAQHNMSMDVIRIDLDYDVITNLEYCVADSEMIVEDIIYYSGL